jgi:hypothetical protein
MTSPILYVLLVFGPLQGFAAVTDFYSEAACVRAQQWFEARGFQAICLPKGPQ